MVLELVPAPLAAAITERLSIPTIGIGAGAGCSGQVQVVTDMLGMSAEFTPKHARHYVELYTVIGDAARAYSADVASGNFPGPSQSTGHGREGSGGDTRPNADRPAGDGRDECRHPARSGPLAVADSVAAPGLVKAPWVARTRSELRVALANAPRPVGFVPTMGALHAGHASLITRARAENAAVVVSIFVNPRQFNEAADFQKYPRTEAADLAVAGAAGADVAFIPTVEDVYPAGFQTLVRVGELTEPLEGAARPGHFEGVTTVVAILLGLVRADRAYFGQKDAQQLLVIRRMALDLGIGTEIVACPSSASPTVSP